MTLLEIVSVNYFGASSVEELASSLRRQTRPDWALTIVDNSGTAEERSALQAIADTDDRISVAAAPGNLGYFGGAHWWLSQQGGVRSDWTAVCNADLALSGSDFVETLATLAPTAEIVAPQIRTLPDLRPQNPFMLHRPTVQRMLLRRLALSRRSTAEAAKWLAARRGRRAPAPEFGAQDIYAPHGAFMIFNRAYFAAGGSLYHPPFLFGEEITIAERARELSLRVYFEPRLQVLHREHQATSRASEVVFTSQRDAAAYAHRLIRGGPGDRG